MKSFELNGQWAIAEDGAKFIAGTLSFSKKGLYLKLLGSFKNRWSPIEANDYPYIKGIVEFNPYGSFVSLYKCFTTRMSTHNGGIATETIRVNRAILGSDHLSDQTYEFDYLSVRFTYLADWVGWMNFKEDWKTDSDLQISVQYRRPGQLSYPFDDGCIKIATSVGSSKSIGRASITEQSHLVVEPLKETQAYDAGNQYFYKLQNLLSFAADTPNETDEISFAGGEITYGTTTIPKKYHLFGSQIFRLKGKKELLHPQDMVFTLDDARRAGVNVFQNWLDLTKRHEPFIADYFPRIYKQPYYLDDKFRSIMSAFKTYCLSAFSPTEKARSFLASATPFIDAFYDVDERQFLDGIIPVGTELDIPFHMLRLLNENTEIMSKIINRDFHDFVMSAFIVLSSIERRSSEMRKFQDFDLYYDAEKIRWLMKVVLLKELGFDLDCIRICLDRNKNFNDLKTV